MIRHHHYHRVASARCFAILLLMVWVGALTALAPRAWSEGPSEPGKLVEFTVRDVVADMHANQALYEKEPDKLRAMVRDRVAPHFDHLRMTQLVMANHWASANPEQRLQVSEAFRDLMVRTYANAMFVFRDSPVRVLSEQRSAPDRAAVRLRVTDTSGNPVDVMLRMENRAGRWQIIDVVVGGVSLVITYRGAFADTISKGGIDGLIDSLRQGSLQATL